MPGISAIASKTSEASTYRCDILPLCGQRNYVVSPIIELILAGLLSYLLGSIPFGVVMARLLGWPDPRNYGSGHTGGLNVSRGAGRGAMVLSRYPRPVKGAWGGPALADCCLSLYGSYPDCGDGCRRWA